MSAVPVIPFTCIGWFAAGVSPSVWARCGDTVDQLAPVSTMNLNGPWPFTITGAMMRPM